jgi:hypothetical protein
LSFPEGRAVPAPRWFKDIGRPTATYWKVGAGKACWLVPARFDFATSGGQPRLLLDDVEPLQLSRDHSMSVERNGACHPREPFSTLGTIMNGVLAGENEVIAGGDSRFALAVTIR